MKLHSLAASVTFALVAASAALSAACNSDDSSSTTPAQNDATSYCATLSNYVSTCKITDPCKVASAQTCSQYVAAFSPAALAAFAACAPSLTCSDGGSDTASDCIAEQEAEISPSAAQMKLAADYCNACAASYAEDPTTCATTDFYAQLTTANTEGGASGTSADIGSPFLELNDALIASVDTSCALTIGADAGPVGCVAGFEECAGTIIDKAVKTPAECQSETPGAQ